MLLSAPDVNRLLSNDMAPIKSLEHFRVNPRWLFVKITDHLGNYGWGEATLEGHTRAVEGTLDDLIERVVGDEAELASLLTDLPQLLLYGKSPRSAAHASS